MSPTRLLLLLLCALPAFAQVTAEAWFFGENRPGEDATLQSFATEAELDQQFTRQVLDGGGAFCKVAIGRAAASLDVATMEVSGAITNIPVFIHFEFEDEAGGAAPEPPTNATTVWVVASDQAPTRVFPSGVESDAEVTRQWSAQANCVVLTYFRLDIIPQDSGPPTLQTFYAVASR